MTNNSPTANENVILGDLLRQNFQSLLPVQEPAPQKNIYKYPYLDKDGIKATIQNGKRFAEAFNQEQNSKSGWINETNYDLRLATKENPHTTEQKVLFLQFKQDEKLTKAAPLFYNQKVLEFNRKNGTNFLLRSYRTLRSEIAVTFSHLVFYYAAQIRDNNAWKLNAGVTTAGTLPRLLTNSESLKRYKVEGVSQCPYKNDAILKHVHNLVEAGMLINYKSHGRNMGFSVEFNPEILAVQDYKTPNLQKPTNQLIRKYKTAKSTYSDCITRTCQDKNEIKGDGKASPKEKLRNAVKTAITGNSYRNTKSEENPVEIKNAEAEISVKKSAEVEKKQVQCTPVAAKNLLSDHLEAKIQPTWDLCKELSENEHINHISIDKKQLITESKTGTMSQVAFRELLFQEFMKVISRLKKDNQSAAGAFYRAFEELEDKKLITMTGRYFTKEMMLEKFEIWLKCVDYAEKWAKKRDFNLLFINDYLDTQRRDGKEVGFWYLVEKTFPQEEIKKEKRKLRRAKNTAAAQKRKKIIKLDRVKEFGYRSIKPGTNAKSLSDYEKARKAVRKYLFSEDKSAAFTELHRYCRYNLSKTIVDGLKNLIEDETANLRKYNA